MMPVPKLPEAQEDLIEIWLHIALDSPRRADRFLDMLEAKMRLLAGSPRMGRPHPELADRLRGFPVDDYMIYYRETDQGIEVIRVLHGARDLLAIFPEPDAGQGKN